MKWLGHQTSSCFHAVCFTCKLAFRRSMFCGITNSLGARCMPTELSGIDPASADCCMCESPSLVRRPSVSALHPASFTAECLRTEQKILERSLFPSFVHCPPLHSLLFANVSVLEARVLSAVVSIPEAGDGDGVHSSKNTSVERRDGTPSRIAFADSRWEITLVTCSWIAAG